MKHIDTNCESLQKPVRIVSGVVEKSQISGINGNILIEQHGEDVSFTGTDLDTKIKTSAKVGNPESSGDFTVSAQKLNEILNTLKPSDPVAIDVNGDKLVLTSPNSRFFLQSLPANEFPNIKNIEAINSCLLYTSDASIQGLQAPSSHDKLCHGGKGHPLLFDRSASCY